MCHEKTDLEVFVVATSKEGWVGWGPTQVYTGAQVAQITARTNQLAYAEMASQNLNAPNTVNAVGVRRQNRSDSEGCFVCRSLDRWKKGCPVWLERVRKAKEKDRLAGRDPDAPRPRGGQRKDKETKTKILRVCFSIT